MPVLNNPPSVSAGGFLPVITALIVGVAAGSAIGVGIFVYFDEISPSIESVIKIIIPLLGAFALIAVLAVPLTIVLIKRLTANAAGTLEDVVRKSSLSIEAAIQKDAELANKHAAQALLSGVAWYAPAAARRWVVNTSLSLLVAMVGLIGTVLLYKQISLLKDQNDKISTQIDLLKTQNEKLDQQTIVSEATRRGAIATEMSEILKEINNAISDDINSIVSEKTIGEPMTLTKSLISRIVAFSKAATPYYILGLDSDSILYYMPENSQVKMPKYYLREVSPERGRLLIELIARDIKIPADAIFDYADLRGSTLSDCNLDGLRLPRADFNRATIKNCTMRNATISAASFRYTSFANVNLDGARAMSVDFVRTDFESTTMRNALIYLSKFGDPSHSNLDLTGSKFAFSAQEGIHKTAKTDLPDNWLLEFIDNYYIVKKDKNN